MKARLVLSVAAILVCAAGFGCETAHQHSRVSYPDSVMGGSGDSLGNAVFSQDIQTRMYSHKQDVDAKTAVAGADENSGN